MQTGQIQINCPTHLVCLIEAFRSHMGRLLPYPLVQYHFNF